jgi:hypothetical protein
VPALLRFQQESEGRIAADIDPLDRVHLHGDIQGHGGLGKKAGVSLKVSRRAGRRKRVVNILPAISHL